MHTDAREKLIKYIFEIFNKISEYPHTLYTIYRAYSVVIPIHLYTNNKYIEYYKMYMESLSPSDPHYNHKDVVIRLEMVVHMVFA